MRHLIAEKRLDKNGNLVTRYVSATPEKSSATTIPSPSLPVPNAQSAAHDLIEIAQIHHHKFSNEDYAYAMNTVFSDGIVQEAADLFNGSWSDQISAHVSKGLTEVAEDFLIQDQGIHIDIDESLVQRVETEIAIGKAFTHSEPVEIREYVKNSHRSRRKAEELVVRMVSEGVMTLDDEDNNHTVIQNKLAVAVSLLDLIKPTDVKTLMEHENPHERLVQVYDERERIYPHLKEFQSRGEFNFGLLEALESHNTPMQDGLL